MKAQTEAHGYVLGVAEGEHLIHHRNPGSIIIKVDPIKGSKNVACGTQEVPIGAGIPIHILFDSDEAFYVLGGSGAFILNDVHHPFEKGSTIFIPKNSWHGFANWDSELLLLWIVTPTGLDAFFRETCNRPGEPRRELTREARTPSVSRCRA